MSRHSGLVDNSVEMVDNFLKRKIFEKGPGK
jgi:hypothetical protein